MLNNFQQDREDPQASLDKREITEDVSSNSPLYSESIVSVSNMSKKYKLGNRSIEALNNISLNISKGEFMALTGPSGSGKSTLLQLIGCLDKPTSGSIIVNGQEITTLRDEALSDLRQSTIGFIFQSFYLQPFLTVADNIAVPAMFTNSKRQFIEEKVITLLQQIGLSERAKHLPKELSGGQIQRAAIARALINNPKIILADEPTGNLDSKNSQIIIDLFKTIRSEFGTTIVIVTHDQNIANQTDRIVTLEDGVIQ